MKLKSLVSTLFLATVSLFNMTSCDGKPTSSLELRTTSQTFVVPGTTSNCSDIRTGTPPYNQSVNTDFFQLQSFVLDWKGTDILYPASITLSVNHPNLASEYTCTYSGTTLTDALVTMPIPAQTTVDITTAGATCYFSCGGLSRKPGTENTSFSATALIEFKGYSQAADGSNLRPVRASTSVRLNFF